MTFAPCRLSKRAPQIPAPAPSMTLEALGRTLAIGDLVFIRVKARPFREVADATGSWTNHVGIVIETAGDEPMVAESTFPWSRETGLARFVARSEHRRVAVSRMITPLAPEQASRVVDAARRRFGVCYDTGFDLRSRRQFCSRYVREVLDEATGIAVGEVETFGRLLDRNRRANLGFWKLWYLGAIPWHRETVTPASVMSSDELVALFDGVAPLGLPHRVS